MQSSNNPNKSGNVSLCRFRIRQAYESLSATERKIADYILANESEIPGKNSAELARMTGTSSATVMRFCRAIGFLGISDFKLSLMHDELAPDANYMHLEKGDTNAVVKQKVVEYHKSLIDKLLLDHDYDNIERAARAIEAANRVVIIGDGGSGGSSKIAFDVFLQMKIPAEHVSDPMYEALVISTMRPGDVLFLVNNCGRNRNIVDNAKFARKYGVTTIGIVGRSGTAIGPYLDIEFHAGQYARSFFSETLGARICELCVLSVLYSVLSLRQDKLTEEYRKNLNDILSVKRVPPGEKA